MRTFPLSPSWVPAPWLTASWLTAEPGVATPGSANGVAGCPVPMSWGGDVPRSVSVPESVISGAPTGEGDRPPAHGLGRFHLDHGLVDGHDVAGLDAPGDDLGFGEALAKI